MSPQVHECVDDEQGDGEREPLKRVAKVPFRAYSAVGPPLPHEAVGFGGIQLHHEGQQDDSQSFLHFQKIDALHHARPRARAIAVFTKEKRPPGNSRPPHSPESPAGCRRLREMLPAGSERNPPTIDDDASPLITVQDEWSQDMVARHPPAGTVVEQEVTGKVASRDTHPAMVPDLGAGLLYRFPGSENLGWSVVCRLRPGDLFALEVRAFELPEAKRAQHRKQRHGREGRPQGGVKAPSRTRAPRGVPGSLDYTAGHCSQGPVVLGKILVIAIFLGIVVAMGSALYFLVKDRGDSDRLARALTWRVAISVSLFALLFVFWWAGLIQPHALYP